MASKTLPNIPGSPAIRGRVGVRVYPTYGDNITATGVSRTCSVLVTSRSRGGGHRRTDYLLADFVSATGGGAVAGGRGFPS